MTAAIFHMQQLPIWSIRLDSAGVVYAQDLKFCDSMDKDGSVGVWSYLDLPDPEKGAPGFPRLLIENRAYASKAFRKLHMELAHRQDGLQVPYTQLPLIHLSR